MSDIVVVALKVVGTVSAIFMAPTTFDFFLREKGEDTSWKSFNRAAAIAFISCMLVVVAIWV